MDPVNKDRIKGIILAIWFIVNVAIILYACEDSSSSSSRKSSSGGKVTGSGAGGYDMPNENESFSDYVKRVDPELYKSMTDRYDSVAGR